MATAVDYKTHILIGVRDNGAMTVISDWPHVPKQAEVQSEIDACRNGYMTYVLCTPTSIMPADHYDRSGAAGNWRSAGRRA
jgi:hypothetical protein